MQKQITMNKKQITINPMKNFLILTACCLVLTTYSVSAQTYQRNYSTHTEYGTVPQTTVPSANKPNYQPTYDYNKPEKSEKEITTEAETAAWGEVMKQIKFYYEKEDYKSVISTCIQYEKNHATAIKYSDFDIYFISSCINYSPGDIRGATSKFRNLYGRPDLNVAVANILQQQRQYAEAYKYFEAANNSPDLDNYKNLLGYSFTCLKAGDFVKSHTAFSRLMLQTKNDPVNYYNLAVLYLNEGTPDDTLLAWGQLSKFISESTDKRDAYLLRAHVYLSIGEYDKSISDVKEYMKTNDCAKCPALIAKADRKVLENKKKEENKIAAQKKYDLEKAEKTKIKEAEEKGKQVELDVKNKIAYDNSILYKKAEEEYYSFIKLNNIVETIYTGKIESGKCPTYEAAMRNNDFKSVFILMKLGNDINKQYPEGKGNAFAEALGWRRFFIAEFLINSGFTNRFDPKKRTPLHIVCDHDLWGSKLKAYSAEHLKMARLIIEKGADVNAQDYLGSTPFYFAASRSDFELAKLLIEKGAITNIPGGYYHKTALEAAKLANDKKRIKFLKKHEPK